MDSDQVVQNYENLTFAKSKLGTSNFHNIIKNLNGTDGDKQSRELKEMIRKLIVAGDKTFRNKWMANIVAEIRKDLAQLHPSTKRKSSNVPTAGNVPPASSSLPNNPPQGQESRSSPAIESDDLTNRDSDDEESRADGEDTQTTPEEQQDNRELDGRDTATRHEQDHATEVVEANTAIQSHTQSHQEELVRRDGNVGDETDDDRSRGGTMPPNDQLEGTSAQHSPSAPTTVPDRTSEPSRANGVVDSLEATKQPTGPQTTSMDPSDIDSNADVDDLALHQQTSQIHGNISTNGTTPLSHRVPGRALQSQADPLVLEYNPASTPKRPFSPPDTTERPTKKKKLSISATTPGKTIDDALLNTGRARDFLHTIVHYRRKEPLRFEDMAKRIKEQYNASVQSPSEERGKAQPVPDEQMNKIITIILEIFRPDTLLKRLQKQLRAYRAVVTLRMEHKTSAPTVRPLNLLNWSENLLIKPPPPPPTTMLDFESGDEHSSDPDTEQLTQSASQLLRNIDELDCQATINGMVLALNCYHFTQQYDRLVKQETNHKPQLGSGQGIKSHVKNIILRNCGRKDEDLVRANSRRRYHDTTTNRLDRKLDHYIELGRFVQVFVDIPEYGDLWGLILLWPLKANGASTLTGNNVKGGPRFLLRTAIQVIAEEMPGLIDILERLTHVVHAIGVPGRDFSTVLEMMTPEEVDEVTTCQNAIKVLFEGDLDEEQRQSLGLTPMKVRTTQMNHKKGHILELDNMADDSSDEEEPEEENEEVEEAEEVTEPEEEEGNGEDGVELQIPTVNSDGEDDDASESVSSSEDEEQSLPTSFTPQVAHANEGDDLDNPNTRNSEIRSFTPPTEDYRREFFPSQSGF